MTFLLLNPPGAFGQNQEVLWQTIQRESQGINSVTVELYRGWVELIPSNLSKVKIEYSTFNYDQYVASGQFQHYVDPKGRTRLDISTRQKELIVQNNTSREIMALKIYLPSTLDISLNINHFGHIKSSGISGEQEVNIFKGTIALNRLTNSASAHIVRDGNIEVLYASLSKEVFSAYSTYDGNIDLTLPSKSSFSIEASSDLGIISDEFNLRWKKENPQQFELKEKDGTVSTKTSYTQKAKIGNASSYFFLKTIHGNILIQNSQ